MRRRGFPSSFQRLADYLAVCPTDEVTLTFAAIAAIISQALPEDAILHNTWWRTQANRPVQLWQARGWEARADRDHLRVTFTRVRREE